jgi:Fur family peroxide stress response transcriptional regulator
MSITAEETRERMEHFVEACRRAGVKLTHQRLEIFREVARTTAHPDAITVYRGVRRRIPTVSLDTVYRALATMVELGVLSTLGSSREKVRFDANTRPHHHFVCVRCGIIRDFYSDSLDQLATGEELEDVGRVESAHVELRGICSNCASQAIQD